VGNGQSEIEIKSRLLSAIISGGKNMTDAARQFGEPFSGATRSKWR
jgi:hypothetical protein